MPAEVGGENHEDLSKEHLVELAAHILVLGDNVPGDDELHEPTGGSQLVDIEHLDMDVHLEPGLNEKKEVKLDTDYEILHSLLAVLSLQLHPTLGEVYQSLNL